eukprot:gnl/TRDRNA2_/TRDRNA2_200819_c0_seq1.p1 gnl/TRDRNA2_/TRDRNA2_200819_c0~~gnl/TRDRNA2_/TRDRNA2_200819_c0_seq1.p1  ORF type:complete len:325 (+),score=37.16 gnl/TRDRNA2_/TRDRNA2_200819_c0_seq1:66-1040(+)
MDGGVDPWADDADPWSEGAARGVQRMKPSQPGGQANSDPWMPYCGAAPSSGPTSALDNRSLQTPPLRVWSRSLANHHESGGGANSAPRPAAAGGGPAQDPWANGSDPWAAGREGRAERGPGAVGSVEEAIAKYGMDEFASKQLRSLPPSEADHILSSVNPSVRNPSAFITVAVNNAVKRVSGTASVSASSVGSVEEAIAKFGLDEPASKQLRELPRPEADQILSSLNPSVRNPASYIAVAVQNATKRIATARQVTSTQLGSGSRSHTADIAAGAGHNSVGSIREQRAKPVRGSDSLELHLAGLPDLPHWHVEMNGKPQQTFYSM